MAELGDVFGMLAALSKAESEKQMREHPEIELNSIIKRMEKEKKSETGGISALDSFVGRDPDKHLKLISDAFRKTKSDHVKDMIINVYERAAYLREPSKKVKEAICEDLITGLKDKDWHIRASSANVFGMIEDMPSRRITEGINPELGTKVVKELIASMERGIEGQAAYGLGGVDYSKLPKEIKKEAADAIAKKAIEFADNITNRSDFGFTLSPASTLNRIGDDKTVEMVTNRWLQLLDSGNKRKIDIAMEFLSQIRCEPLVDKLEELKKRGMSDFWFTDIVEHSASRRQEDILLKVVQENGHIISANIEVLKKRGWDKSVEFLSEIVKNPPKGTSEYELGLAKDAIKEIKKRIASSKLLEKAAEKMKGDIEAKEKPKLLKQPA